MVANIIKVKVYPKDLKSIPDILPYNQLLHGDPVELELTKKEICRCMNFGDVYDMTSGEEVLIDEISFKEIVEYIEEEEDTEAKPEDGEGEESNGTTTVGDELTNGNPVGDDLTDEPVESGETV